MTATKLGIWMDHRHAYLTEFTVPPMKTQLVTTTEDDITEENRNASENRKHTKEQHQRTEYFKKLSDSIRHYEGVILFGPTNAKDELYNMLKKNHLFDHIDIDVQQTDQMTEDQRNAFIRKHFNKH